MEKLTITDAISLTAEMVVDKDLYWHCGFSGLIGFTEEIDCEDNFTTIHYLWNKPAVPLTQIPLGADGSTIRTAWKKRREEVNTRSFVVHMPLSTWCRVFEELKKVSVPKRKTYTRVFCYLYYWAMRFNGVFTHSRQQIVNEIHIQNNLFTEATVWLEEHNLLKRSGYLVVNSNRQARGYSFDEDLWTAAAHFNHSQFYAAK